MKNEIVSLSLSTDSIIAIIGIVVTVLIPVIGGIYKIVTSTKKYELTENYRKELLQWYTSVVEIMIRIIHSMESQEFFSDEFQPQKTEMLSRLSALTEIGRFYFPNVIKEDYFGHDKPSAYQGYRDILDKHLNENGIRYFCALSKEFVLITTNTRHPAFNVEDENLHIIYQNELSLKDALIKLKSEYGCERITIQTGGTLNNLFLREKLFDYVDIIIAPVLIGGKDTSTLIDGKSLTEECELSKLGVVKLQECVVLENSYLRLRYEVIH